MCERHYVYKDSNKSYSYYHDNQRQHQSWHQNFFHHHLGHYRRFDQTFQILPGQLTTTASIIFTNTSVNNYDPTQNQDYRNLQNISTDFFSSNKNLVDIALALSIRCRRFDLLPVRLLNVERAVKYKPTKCHHHIEESDHNTDASR